MRFVVLLAASLVFAIPAIPCQACINDRDVGNAEKEFKSQYNPTRSLASPGQSEEPVGSSMERLVPYSALFGGAGLLVVSCLVIGVHKLRTRP